MKNNILDQPLFRLIVPAFYGMMMYILILLVNNSLYTLTEAVFSNELLLCMVLAYLISEPIRLVIILFEKVLKERLKKTTSIIAMLTVNLAVGALITLATGYFYFTLIEGASYFSYYQSTLITLMVIYGLSAVFYSIFFLSIYFLSVKNESVLKKEALKRQNLEHQLEIFNNQINPDLLFQSLESLISLVHHSSDEAEEFVDRLASFYRSILDNRKKELIPLKEEIAACKNLAYLFKVRFPNQITLTIKGEKKSTNVMVVPGALTVILDCIINGNIISAYQPMQINLNCQGEEGYIVVKHQDNEKLNNSSYIKNCRRNLHEAYAYFTDDPVIEIKAYGDAFVKIPSIILNETI